MIYKECKTNEISFPLGGIGTGCIGLAGNGRLIDWEIFNQSNKGSLNGFSHFAVRAEKDGKVLDARILNGDLNAPYTGEFGHNLFGGFGWGPRRGNLCGMPHFKNHTFKGEYPFAELDFTDDNFPGNVNLNAWNPFIPGNSHDSSIPAALFEIELENTSQETIDYTIVGVLANPFGNGGTVNNVITNNGQHQLVLKKTDPASDDITQGDITLGTDAEDISFQEYWYRGGWCDDLEIYWREFFAGGKFKNRSYNNDAKQNSQSKCDHGLLAAHITLEAGEKKKVRFSITWNIPFRENSWNKGSVERAKEAGIATTWKNWYATQWETSQDSCNYVFDNYRRLHDETKRFHDSLFNSTLPDTALDAISSTMSVLKSPTCLRLEDGTFYGWEGVGVNAGSCEGSCTHVWNYCQALPFLFPDLERSMRNANYNYNVDENGGSHFRLQLPLGVKADIDSMRPCVDGQFGDVIKTYRDWKISGDSDWLATLWPTLKKTVEYAWSDKNYDLWDPEKTGVISGRQHHTLDMELFGPNAWLNGFYLAGLKAAAEMATQVGDHAFAEECQTIFAKGKQWTDDNLFNGEYYYQKQAVDDREYLTKYSRPESKDKAEDRYWSDELGEMKYQIGEGCEIDMVTAQWHANLYGLGEIFDPEQCLQTLKSIYKYNFKHSMRTEYNPWRNFSLNDEGGMIICSWPENKFKPMVPIPYSQEAMHGFEYATSILMIQSGLVDEGMTVIKSIRDRYDGEKRNPWNEIECGSNYARSMAAYSLLNTFSGFEFDQTRNMIGFKPLQDQDNFQCFWSLGTAWGEVQFTAKSAEISVQYGEINLKEIKLPFDITEVTLSEKSQAHSCENGSITLDSNITLKANQTLCFAKA